MEDLAARTLAIYEELEARDPPLARRFLRDLQAATGFVPDAATTIPEEITECDN